MNALLYLAHLAASVVAYPVVAFVLAVTLDDVLGVVSAARARSLSAQKLPSFLASQFGTHEAAALGGLIFAAYLSAPSGADLRDVLYSAATLGASALTVKVIADIKDKASALVSLRPVAAGATKAG